MSELNPHALPAGTLFHGRYNVVRCLKAGGMGAVYEVIHVETKRRRALKVMLPSVIADPDLRARFRLEATVTAEIESDHIVETFDAGVDEATGAPFLVMELLRGEELSDLLARRGRLPPEEVVGFLFQVALALDKTLAAGIVHRDLKPENLFITYRDDATPRLKVLDFGIAKVIEQSTRRQTRSIGTPLYMSPEQVRGDATLSPASDLYAFGQIAYTLLVGEAYWWEQADSGASLYALLLKITQGLTEPACARALRRSGVTLPPAFDAWWMKATALEPANRFTTASAMVATLAEALGVTAPAFAGSRPPSPASAPAVGPSEAAARQPPESTDRREPDSNPGNTTAALVSSRGLPRHSPVPAVLAIAAGLAVAAAIGVAVIKLTGRDTGAKGSSASAPSVVPPTDTAPSTSTLPLATTPPASAPPGSSSPALPALGAPAPPVASAPTTLPTPMVPPRKVPASPSVVAAPPRPKTPVPAPVPRTPDERTIN